MDGVGCDWDKVSMVKDKLAAEIDKVYVKMEEAR